MPERVHFILVEVIKMIVNFVDTRYCGGQATSIDSSEITQIYFVEEISGEYHISIATEKERYEVGRYPNRKSAANAVNRFFRSLSGDTFYRAIAGDCTVYDWDDN